MSEKCGVGVSFQEAFPSFKDSVRDSSLTQEGQAVRDGGVSRKLIGGFNGSEF